MRVGRRNDRRVYLMAGHGAAQIGQAPRDRRHHSKPVISDVFPPAAVVLTVTVRSFTKRMRYHACGTIPVMSGTRGPSRWAKARLIALAISWGPAKATPAQRRSAISAAPTGSHSPGKKASAAPGIPAR